MATLLRRNGTYYMKWTKLGHETRKSLKTKNLQVAKKRMRDEEDRLYRGDDITAEKALPDMTQEWAWSVYAERAELKAITIEHDKAHWERFWAWSGVYTLSSITQATAAEYKLALRKSEKYKPSTINKKVFTISKVYNYLIATKLYAGSNPFKGETRVKGAKARIKFIAWEEVLAYLEASKQHGQSFYLFVVLGALAGMRKSEANRARWEHVDWAGGRMYVDGTKNQESAAHIPLHPMLRTALEPCRQDDGYIAFPELEFVPGNLYRFRSDRLFASVAAACGFRASMHTLRHSVATHMLDKGFSLAEIAVFLRHGSLQSTQIYASLKGVSLNMDRL